MYGRVSGFMYIITGNTSHWRVGMDGQRQWTLKNTQMRCRHCGTKIEQIMGTWHHVDAGNWFYVVYCTVKGYDTAAEPLIFNDYLCGLESTEIK